MIIQKLLSCIKRKNHHKNPRASLNDLDQKLAKYLDFQGGFFIEAGANDGYSQSNTYFLEEKLGWRGILVEGIPELYKKCKRERRRSIVHHCALVSSEFPHPTVTMHYAHLMSLVDGAFKTKHDERKHLGRGIEIQNLKGSYSIDVPARTLESILEGTRNLPEIDFFSLDVEGYELQVLEGLNLSKYRPRYILVEARYFEEVNAFLVKQDYALLEKLTHHDCLYQSTILPGPTVQSP